MLVNFNTIPEESRIWIYAAEQKLTNEQESYILQSISDHIKNWESHKVPNRQEHVKYLMQDVQIT